MFCLFSVRIYNEQCEYKQTGIKYINLYDLWLNPPGNADWKFSSFNKKAAQLQAQTRQFNLINSGPLATWLCISAKMDNNKPAKFIKMNQTLAH